MNIPKESRQNETEGVLYC